jgi:hypothetical protein
MVHSPGCGCRVAHPSWFCFDGDLSSDTELPGSGLPVERNEFSAAIPEMGVAAGFSQFSPLEFCLAVP